MVKSSPATAAIRALFLVVVVSAPAAAQLPAAVRVVNPSPISRWFPSPASDIIWRAEPGTTLEVLDEERGWYWVITPRDAFGTRRGGWIKGKDVEIMAGRAASLTPEQRRLAELAAAATGAPLQPRGAAPSAAAGLSSAASPSASVSTGPAPESTTIRPARPNYVFEDVYFSLNQSKVTDEDVATLESAANALKSDPLLRMNIEGHTCNLGTPAYNLRLGDRRAAAVKDYLISKGVPADRLRTKSFGEEQPKYDNSVEETRRMNRRVALVPSVEP